MFENYAISLGHNPESPAFPFIVEGIKDLSSYIVKRRMDPKDPMYAPSFDQTGSTSSNPEMDKMVEEITAKF